MLSVFLFFRDSPELRNHGIMDLRNYGITEGFASASPDYETTSQQDNECGFASASQTMDNRTWASPGFDRRLRRHVVYKK